MKADEFYFKYINECTPLILEIEKTFNSHIKDVANKHEKEDARVFIFAFCETLCGLLIGNTFTAWVDEYRRDDLLQRIKILAYTISENKKEANK